MSQRDRWAFEYPAEKVAAGATDKAIYHKTRIEFWGGQRDVVLEELRRSGLEITAQQVTGGERHDVQFDPKLKRRLDECQSKIAEHERDKDRFDVFAKVLSRHPDQTLYLEVDDVDYFGLADEPVGIARTDRVGAPVTEEGRRWLEEQRAKAGEATDAAGEPHA